MRYLHFVMLPWLLTFAGCENSRPSASDAAAYFAKVNPDAVIAKVRLDEDEVVARTFVVTYAREGKVSLDSYVTYTERAGAWEPTITPKQ